MRPIESGPSDAPARDGREERRNHAPGTMQDPASAGAGAAPGPGQSPVTAETVAEEDLRPTPKQVRRHDRWQAAARLDPWTTGLLAAAVLLGLTLRLVHVNQVGFNSDEAVYAGQAASIDGDPRFTPWFPVFRAHPLLFQFLLSLVFRSGVGDLAGRLLEVAVGMATVAVTFLLGRRLLGARAGAVAALLLAIMPYHVVVTRQVLLDGPMTLATTTSLLFLARWDRGRRPRDLLVAALVLGLAALTKETSLIFVFAAYVYLGLTTVGRQAWRTAGLGLLVTVGTFALHPLLVLLVGHRSRASSYLAWQLFRPPNQSLNFYAQQIPTAVGVLLLLAAVLTLAMTRWSSREILLVAWIAVPVLFFTVWPVKGFQYLLPITPPLAVLAAQALTVGRLQAPGWLQALMRRTPQLHLPQQRLPGAGSWRRHRADWEGPGRLAAVTVVALSLIVPAVNRVSGNDAAGLAGAGGIPGGRETGDWVARNVPEGASLITIGPSMANVLAFYGNRRCRALSVSTNPLHRNPVYEPIPNPDLAVRHLDYQYVVWDAYSAQRSKHFSEAAMRLVRKYDGRVAHVETLSGSSTPVIVVYQVHA